MEKIYTRKVDDPKNFFSKIKFFFQNINLKILNFFSIKFKNFKNNYQFIDECFKVDKNSFVIILSIINH